MAYDELTKSLRNMGLMFFICGVKDVKIFNKGTVPGVAIKTSLSAGEVMGSIPGQPNRTQYCQRLATTAMFLRGCVAQAISRGDRPCHSLHASL